jgi:hypothetical protein
MYFHILGLFYGKPMPMTIGTRSVRRSMLSTGQGMRLSPRNMRKLVGSRECFHARGVHCYPQVVA